MGYEIFPTNNDVATTTSNGETITETNLSSIIGAVGSQRKAYIVSGITTSTAAGLVIDIAAGVAIINGYRFEFDAATSHTATDALTDNTLQIRLDKTADLVTGYTLVESTGSSPVDDDHLPICEFTSSTTITSVSQARVLHAPGCVSGTYTGDDTEARLISLGFTPRRVEVCRRDVTTERYSSSVILPEHSDPGDFTGIPSLTCDENNAWSWSTFQSLRPEIADGGFYVREQSIANSLNDSGVVYDYIATA